MQRDQEAFLESSLAIERSAWWRFASYEVVEDHVVPVPNSKLIKFDPIISHGHEPPHVEIYNFVKSEKLPRIVCEFGQSYLSSKQTDRVLAWCARFGFFGLLHSRVLQISCWPRWGRYARWPGLYAHFDTHRRTPKGWSTRTSIKREKSSTEAKEFSPLSEYDYKFLKRFGAPGVPSVLYMKDGLFKNGSPQESGLLSYFPAMPSAESKHFVMPLVGSDAFWRIYAEPLSDFVRTANQIASTMDAIDLFLRGKDWTQNQRHEIGTAFDFLNQHLWGVHPFVTPLEVPEKLRDGFTSHSMLQTIARRIQLDILARRAPKQCNDPVCGRWFHSSDKRQLFCSSRCQALKKVRDYRKRQRTKQPSE